jgi:hypothetical protein
MPGLVPGIHVVPFLARGKTWMAGTSPAMTRTENAVPYQIKYCFVTISPSLELSEMNS